MTTNPYATWDEAIAAGRVTDDADGWPDRAMVPVVAELRRRGIVTLQSCAGHQGSDDGHLWTTQLLDVDTAAFSLVRHVTHPEERWEFWWKPADRHRALEALLAARVTTNPTPTPAGAQETVSGLLGADHVMRWTYEDGGTRAEAVCLAAPDADCRLEPVDHDQCQCEHWGRIERRDDGTIWHALTDGHRDLTLPRSEDQWHQVRPSTLSADSGCNVALFINETGCAEEMTPEDEHHTFVVADVPFEPVWENDGCSWRPKPVSLRETAERAWSEGFMSAANQDHPAYPRSRRWDNPYAAKEADRG